MSTSNSKHCSILHTKNETQNGQHSWKCAHLSLISKSVNHQPGQTLLTFNVHFQFGMTTFYFLQSMFIVSISCSHCSQFLFLVVNFHSFYFLQSLFIVSISCSQCSLFLFPVVIFHSFYFLQSMFRVSISCSQCSQFLFLVINVHSFYFL